MNGPVAFGSGLLFAIGLGVSGMTQPGKIVGFLDVAGAWDPSLAFVMIGALAVFAPAYRWSRRRAAPLLAPGFVDSTERTLDARLVGGAALFGAGWGLSGFCPGPALASLGAVSLGGFSHAALVFVPAMLAGMALTARLEARDAPAPACG